MTTTKATIVPVQYAGFEFSGVCLPDETRCLALPQVFNLLTVPQKNASRELKALLGKALTVPQKVKTEVNDRPLNVVTLDEFSLICFRAALKGNEIAKRICEASTQITLQMAFDEALGIKKEVSEYNANLKAIVASKQVRRSLTDTWKEVYDLSGEMPSYGYHTLELYKAIKLDDKYQEYAKQYSKSQRRKFTFRHDYLSKEDRGIIEYAETRIRIYIEDFGLTVEESIVKLHKLNHV